MSGREWQFKRVDPQSDRVAFLEALMSHLGENATVMQAIEFVDPEKRKERERNELYDRIEEEERAKHRAGVGMGGPGDE